MSSNRMIKKLATLLCAGLLVSNLLPPVKVYAEESAPVVIEIASEQDLETLSLNCHDEAWSVGKIILLTKDITLGAGKFTCIPIFNGTFDGQGHSIHTYTYQGDGYISGFFRQIGAYGTVRGLTLSVSLSAGDNSVCTGALAGLNAGSIEDCTVIGSVSGSRETGGLVGINQAGGRILDSFNNAGITGLYYTGGFAGKNYGIIMKCRNYGNVNDNTGWVEMDDQNAGDILGGITQSADLISIHSGVDTGGIAGFSEGSILSCRNYATIGYEHVGYNAGGIAGRQSGVIRNCTNEGTVYGKKDVGGIVGQQEPYIELNQAKSISRAIEQISDSVDTAVADAESANATIRQDLQVLQSQSRAARNIAGNMADQAQNYMNSTADAIDRDTKEAEAKRANAEEYLKSIYEKDRVKEAKDKLSELEKRAETEGVDLQAEIDAARANLNAEIESAAKEASSSLNSVDAAAGRASAQIRGAADDWRRDSGALNASLNGVSASLTALENSTGEASDQLNADIEAINERVKAAYNLISDIMNGVSEEGIDYLFADVSEDSLSLDITGKTTDSTNRGVVKGDINIGGIAGNLSVDDENLESNKLITLGLKTGETYTLSSVIDNCVNYGFATAKSDGAGGIAGLVDKGIIYRSCGYGSAESTTGSYAGGIAGKSEGLILSSYALCSLAGSNDVGGIAGYATAIKECVAMPIITGCEGNKGAVAGEIHRDELTKEADLSRIKDNYYASEDLYGIDDVNYDGAVTGCTYEELLKLPNVPLSFRHLRVSFRAGDKYLGNKEVGYGESLSDLSFPDAPQKEGHYYYWPDLSDRVMIGNIVVEAEYAPDITVLRSELTYEDSGKAAAYLEGSFTPGDKLVAEIRKMEISLSNLIPELKASEDLSIIHIDLSESDETKGKFEGEERSYKLRLYSPYENVRVWKLPQDVENVDGTLEMEELETDLRGSYLNLTLESTEATYLLAPVPKEIWKKVVLGSCLALGILVLILVISAIVRGGRKAKARRIKKAEKTEEKA